MKAQNDADGPNGTCSRGQIIFQDSTGRMVGSLDNHKQLPDTIEYRGSTYRYSGVVDGQGVYTLIAKEALE